jgi:hypothetical protein
MLKPGMVLGQNLFDQFGKYSMILKPPALRESFLLKNKPGEYENITFPRCYSKRLEL